MTATVSATPREERRPKPVAKPVEAGKTHQDPLAREIPEGSPQFKSIEALPERIRVIATLRGLGYTFREIGEQLHVTAQAVSLMLSRHRRAFVKLEGAFEFAKLSARAVNVLGRYGIRSRREANTPAFLAALQRERNCGRKTREEIERWIAEGEESSGGRGFPARQETPSAISSPHPGEARRHAERELVQARNN